MPGQISPTLYFFRLTFLALLLSCMSVATGCRPSKQVDAPTPPKTQPTRQAAIHSVQLQPWPMIIRSQGVLVADEVSSVGTKVAGSVAKVYVDIGDVVHAGKPLVELDRDEFQLHVDQVEAQLAQARSAVGLKPEQAVESMQPENSPPVRQEQALWDETKASLERAKDLQSQGVITASEFDVIVANERVAEARYAGALNAAREKIALIGVRQTEVALARDRLRNAAIVAPFDGFVQQRLVAPGDFVQVGDRIVTLVRTDPLRFRGSVPEHHAQSLAIGQEVRLQIEGIAEPLTVQVTRISPSLEQASRSLMFEAEVANSDQQFRTGLFAEAEIVVNPQAVALIVPQSAVVEFAGSEKVWKVVDGLASEQEVLTGQRRSRGIEILSGLAAGDVILNDGSQGSVARIEPLSNPSDRDAWEQQPDAAGERSTDPAGNADSISNVSG
ncbi:MAG: efflux RND transporter periplasmic adaptor subunit [Planctomycetaceae bacterium]|nr:efflux RND transporter periplasmic adaptor subunit [Planctomycetaceae bacterium]